MTEFAVQEGNVVAVASDLLLLKHAQRRYGADEVVASLLISARVCTAADIQPLPGRFAVVETRGVIAPKRVLFVGTPPLDTFTYDQMHLFARRAVEAIADLGIPVRTITTTVHGTGYGLDGGEAIQRLIQGFRDGLSKQSRTVIDRILFLTLETRSERMLRAAIDTMMNDGERVGHKAVIDRPSAHGSLRGPDAPPWISDTPPLPPTTAATRAANKRRVFVAMPFSEEFQNVYEFGIYPAVRNCGLICERVDEAHFTGDVLGRIREGIEESSLVIADLTEGRPNVYLEVGYAWGRNIPVIFVARKGEQLHFDVSTHRCIFYGRFAQFARDLEELIRGVDARRRD